MKIRNQKMMQQCPNCGKTFEMDEVKIINIDKDYPFVYDIIGCEPFKCKCPHCGEENFYGCSFIHNDEYKGFRVYFSTMDEAYKMLQILGLDLLTNSEEYEAMNDIENAEKYVFQQQKSNAKSNAINTTTNQAHNLMHNNQRLLFLFEKTKTEIENKETITTGFNSYDETSRIIEEAGFRDTSDYSEKYIDIKNMIHKSKYEMKQFAVPLNIYLIPLFHF